MQILFREMPDTSIVGMGTYLSELLNQKYGISRRIITTGVYDLVNGKLDRSKAYQLAEPDVQKILKENPGYRSGDRSSPGRCGGRDASGDRDRR